MKLAITLLAAAVAVSASQHHNHHAHQHLHHKRDQVKYAEDVAVVPGPTVIAYVLNGEPISEADVQRGIKNGTLILAQGGQVAHKPEAAKPPPSSSPAAEYSKPAPAASSPPTYNKPPPKAPSSYGHGDATGVDKEFPDGQIDCSTFPSDHGAVPVDYLGLDGWTGIQKPNSDAGGYGDILTVVKGMYSEGKCCTEGSFCSYACPAGYQKSQWPTTQGATGQSVGGLLCKNGKLHLTNPEMSKTLCMPGTDKVTILVDNQCPQNVPICRTDYPGTESETVPLDSQPGKISPLTCPDADNYYKWQGGHTSAQYYVNPQGTPVHEGCTWGQAGSGKGNFAPMNLGVGWSNGAAWLSIFQNAPTTNDKLEFDVEIKGDGLSGTCKYSNGQYCGGPNYDQCSPTTGCTVSLSSGTATFVLCGGGASSPKTYY